VPPLVVPLLAVPPLVVPLLAVPPLVVPPLAVPPLAVPPLAVPPLAVPPLAVPTLKMFRFSYVLPATRVKSSNSFLVAPSRSISDSGCHCTPTTHSPFEDSMASMSPSGA
jgi:hypothetical protein